MGKAVSIKNISHRYRLYKDFWRALTYLGLWKDEQYLLRKKAITLIQDKREKMPICIYCEGMYVHVHIHHMTMHCEW